MNRPNKTSGYTEVTMFKSDLTGKVYTNLKDLEEGDYNAIKNEVEQEFFEDEYSESLSINIKNLVVLNKTYSPELVAKILEELA
jgi:hypothetical protein